MRLPLLALLAFGIQLLVIKGIDSHTGLLLGGLWLSHLLLIVVVAANWRFWSIRILGLGLVLNLVAMGVNGGLMPVTPETLDEAGLSHLATEIEIGDHIPGTKDVLFERSSVRLYPITDILVVSFPSSRAYSPGDVLVFLGFVAVLVELAGRACRRKRLPSERLSA